MKYYEHVVDPAHANLKYWQVQKANGFTFILPVVDVNSTHNYSILFHKHKKENIVIISPNQIAEHRQQLDVLFRYLKLSKDINHLDCLIGMQFSKDGEISWGRTFKPPATDILHDIITKKYATELTTKEKILTKYIENVFKNYIVYTKRNSQAQQLGKTIKFDIKEIIPKIKRPATRTKAKNPSKLIIRKPIRRI